MVNVYDLNIQNVNYLIKKYSIGVYYLGNIIDEEFEIKYIGRSDIKLKRRLDDHARAQKYTYFRFVTTETIKEAYFLECREWHRLDSLDNKIHPDSPNKLSYICPYCSTNKEFKIKQEERII